MGNTPETVGNKGYLVELKSNGGTTVTPSEGTLTGDFVYQAANCGIENATALTTLTLTEGLTLTFDAGGNSQAPKYYKAGTSFRMYPKNSVKFTSTKKIASVTLKCDVYQGVNCNAEGKLEVTSGAATTEETIVTISNINASEFTLTNANTTTGTKSQLRIKEIAVNYAK